MENKRFDSYRGVPIKQATAILEDFPVLFEQYSDIARILEIGTYRGGLSYFVHNRTPLHIDFLGYEIQKGAIHPNLQRIHNTPRVFKIKEMSYNDDLDYIKNFIQYKGRTLVLIDGNDKALEFSILAPFLKSGDIVMAHDYRETRQQFLDDPVPGFKLEITFEDIERSVKDNDLIPTPDVSFYRSLWACFMKR
jgi:23S rRNA U2552 (ribose-2'-O)-methylase RlmE/FtsJ